MKDKEASMTTDCTFNDSYANMLSGFGGAADPTTQGRFRTSKFLEFSFDELYALYAENGYAQKCVDTIPDEMTRKWREFDGEITPEQIETLTNTEKTLNLQSKFNSAQKLANQFGNAYIVMDIDGTGEPDEPLELSMVKEGSIRGLNVLDRTELVGVEADIDPYSDNYNNFKYYSPRGADVNIHYSRILKFYGKETIGYNRRLHSYLDQSVLSPLYDTLRNVSSAAMALGGYVINGTTDVWKIDDLFQNMQNGDSASQTRSYVAQAQQARSLYNAIVIDAKDDVSTVQKDSSHTREIFELMVRSLVSETNIPATKFLGEAASGFNATGEYDQKNYYDTVSAQQNKKFSPLLDVFDIVLALHCNIPADADLSYEWCPLFQMSEKEIAELEKVELEKYAIILDHNLAEPYHVAKELKQKGIITNYEDGWIDNLERVTKEINAELDSEGEEKTTNDYTSENQTSDEEEEAKDNT